MSPENSRLTETRIVCLQIWATRHERRRALWGKAGVTWTYLGVLFEDGQQVGVAPQAEDLQWRSHNSSGGDTHEHKRWLVREGGK